MKRRDFIKVASLAPVALNAKPNEPAEVVVPEPPPQKTQEDELLKAIAESICMDNFRSLSS
jgi:hypothetical protein